MTRKRSFHTIQVNRRHLKVHPAPSAFHTIHSNWQPGSHPEAPSTWPLLPAVVLGQVSELKENSVNPFLPETLYCMALNLIEGWELRTPWLAARHSGSRRITGAVVTTSEKWRLLLTSYTWVRCDLSRTPQHYLLHLWPSSLLEMCLGKQQRTAPAPTCKPRTSSWFLA